MVHAQNWKSLMSLASGVLALSLTGCGPPDGCAQEDDVETVQSAITGGWTTLTLINGWQAAGRPRRKSLRPAGTVSAVGDYRRKIRRRLRS
jgi:hypothetical protein